MIRAGDEQSNCLLITHTANPTILKKDKERMTRIGLFLPVNAYERNMRMTGASGMNTMPMDEWIKVLLTLSRQHLYRRLSDYRVGSMTERTVGIIQA
jgi:hypothetical protein